MGAPKRPRFGSLQFWPRKRARKILPRVNWKAVGGKDGMLGIIAYKAGMATAIVKDKTDKSMTVNKKVALPVTILEVPKMKIFSVRFYKKGNLMKDVVVTHDKLLKRVLRVPKVIPEFKAPEGWDEIRVIIYTDTKDLYKKTPNISEIAIRHAQPLEFVKQRIGKELALGELVGEMIDIRGLTRGRGLSGPVKRFGISLKSHKSEKGVRRPGSLGPWHPARVTFRVAQAGQLGMFTRVQYNLPIVLRGTAGAAPLSGRAFKHYGSVLGDYIVVAGSVQGPPKRELILTQPLRPTRKQLRKKYEFMELRI